MKTIPIQITNQTISLARDLKPAEIMSNPPSGEGQLPVDILENDREILIVTPLAGVNLDDVEIAITNDVLTIRGQRSHRIEEFGFKRHQVHTGECFWGNFSRSVILPANVDAGLIEAIQRDHVLYVRVPKRQYVKMRIVKIKN